MDAISYSVMLELKTNNQSINKDLEKTLSMVNDYGKQFETAYSSSNRELKRINDSHRGTNKILAEQATIWEKIQYATESAIGKILSIPNVIFDSIKGTVLQLYRFISTITANSILAINTSIDKAAKAYDELTEKWKDASFQGAGGVSYLNSKIIMLQASLGATRDESEKIMQSLIGVGFNVQNIGKGFDKFIKHMQMFNRTTGVSNNIVTKFSKTMQGLGLSYQSTIKINRGLVNAMKQGILSTSDMEQIVGQLSDSLQDLSFAYGTDAIDKYADAMGSLAIAAKRTGVSINKATSLMKGLIDDPKRFIVALGSDAFLKTPAENLDRLTNKVDEMKATMSSLPPGLANEYLKQLYGIDAATLKMLEHNKEVRKEMEKWPDSAKAFSESYKNTHKALERQVTEIKSKLGAIFEDLGMEWTILKQKVFGKLFDKVPAALQQLQLAFRKLYQNIFKITGVGEDFGNIIKKINGWLIDSILYATAWIEAVSQSEGVEKISKAMGEIWEATKIILQLAKELASVLFDGVVFTVLLISEYLNKKIIPYVRDELVPYVRDELVPAAKNLGKEIKAWYEGGGVGKFLDTLKTIGKTLLWIGGAVVIGSILSSIASITMALALIAPIVLTIGGLFAAWKIGKFLSDMWDINSTLKEIEATKKRNIKMNDQLFAAQKREHTGLWTTQKLEDERASKYIKAIKEKGKSEAAINEMIQARIITMAKIDKRNHKNYDTRIKQEMKYGGLTKKQAKTRIDGMIKENKLKLIAYKKLLNDKELAKLHVKKEKTENKNIEKDIKKGNTIWKDVSDRVKELHDGLKNNTDAVNANTNKNEDKKIVGTKSGYAYSTMYGSLKEIVGREYQDKSGKVHIETLKEALKDQAQYLSGRTGISSDKAFKNRQDMFVASAQLDYQNRIKAIMAANKDKTKMEASMEAAKQIRKSGIFKGTSELDTQVYMQKIVGELLPSAAKAMELNVQKHVQKAVDKSPVKAVEKEKTNSQEIHAGTMAGAQADAANTKSITPLAESETNKDIAEHTKGTHENIAAIREYIESKQREALPMFRNNPSTLEISTTQFV